MKELVVVSGKGGTGKTSLVASFAALAEKPVLADCDVDAADLHLVLAPKATETHVFVGGHVAVVREADCSGCGGCLALCRFGAMREGRDAQGGPIFTVDPFSCEGCGVCVHFCPRGAVDFPDRESGAWMVSDTRFGPMVHARLDPGAENSGKLVAAVREEARRAAKKNRRDTILVDGPPGIGCPVIAAIGGATRLLAVTEPTLSGAHDLERVLALAAHFSVPAFVAVNKWDINPKRADAIEAEARSKGAKIAGRVRYDPGVTAAQMRSSTAIEAEIPCAEDIRAVWRTFAETI
jgi:MinD superfamily P-loop ATPase